MTPTPAPVAWMTAREYVERERAKAAAADTDPDG